MPVKDFSRFVKKNRQDFNYALMHYPDRQIGDFTNMLMSMLRECCSEFEEQTLIENLKEEFQDYMENLAKEA